MLPRRSQSSTRKSSRQVCQSIRGSDGIPDSSVSFGFIDTQVISIHTHLSEISCFIPIDAQQFDNESLFATASHNRSDKQIKFWDVNNMQCLFEVQKKGFGIVIAMEFCRNSNIFVTSTSDKCIAVYAFDVVKRLMKLKFSFKVLKQVESMCVYKNMLFLYSSQEPGSVIWMNLTTKKIVKVLKQQDQINTSNNHNNNSLHINRLIPMHFCFVPPLQCLAVPFYGCSLLDIYNSNIRHVYYSNHHHTGDNKKSLNYSNVVKAGSSDKEMNEIANRIIDNSDNNEGTRSSLLNIPKPVNLQRPCKTLTSQGIGIDGVIQCSKMAFFESSLDCVIYVFFDFIVFYSVLEKCIKFIIKDLAPIDNVQYSKNYEILVVQCSEQSSSEQSFYLTFQKQQQQQYLDSPGISPDQQTHNISFSKLSCQKFNRAKSFFFLDEFIIMDCVSSEYKGQVHRRRINLNPKEFLGNQSQKPSLFCSSSSRKTSRFARNSSYSKYKNDNSSEINNLNFASFTTSQQNLDVVEEENNYNNISFIGNTPNNKQNKNKLQNLNDYKENGIQQQQNQEKLCSCAIF